MNSVILIGRVANELETKYTPTGTAILNLIVATDRPSKDGEKKADFPRVTVYGKQAENCVLYSAKGKKIAVQGRIQTGQYEKDGKTIYTQDIIAERVEFLEFKEKDPVPQGFGDYGF